MAQYPGTDGEARVPPARLAADVARIFAACGMGGADAGLLADSLVAADRRGIHGVAFAAVGRSNHCGAMDHWAMRALPHGMVGLAGTNALPTMAPWGGLDKVVGMNPLAIAFPTDKEPPLVLDVAFGMTAHGKIRVYQQKRHPIPEGWATDRDGDPTTDPAAAIEGLILPAGGHKGIGLAVMVGMLSTLLSGAGYGLESGNMADGAVPGQDGSAANRESLVGPTVSATGRYVAVPKASPNHQISLSANWSWRLLAAVLLMVLNPPKDGEPVGNLLPVKFGHESRNGLGMEKMG